MDDHQAAQRHFEALREIVALELAAPVGPRVDWLAGELATRHGDSVLGVLFYGSCLRKGSDEGVLDFWLVVDDYRSAHERRLHALLNRVAPPNVYFVECPLEGRTLRTKYGVISRADFELGTSLAAPQPYVWARFAQPVRLLHARDAAAREFFERAVSQAIVSLVGRLVCQLPDTAGELRFSLAAFWREAFRRTYDSERRPEAEESIRALYAQDEARYDAVASEALDHLGAIGHFAETSRRPRSFSVRLPRHRLALQRLRWRWMRNRGRMQGLVRLLKTAYTFGDWVPYVLWKLERHTGRKIELSDRQRRHPLVFGWPIILPLLLRRNLR